MDQKAKAPKKGGSPGSVQGQRQELRGFTQWSGPGCVI